VVYAPGLRSLGEARDLARGEPTGQRGGWIPTSRWRSWARLAPNGSASAARSRASRGDEPLHVIAPLPAASLADDGRRRRWISDTSAALTAYVIKDEAARQKRSRPPGFPLADNHVLRRAAATGSDDVMFTVA
jgi:hypothetical protein